MVKFKNYPLMSVTAVVTLIGFILSSFGDGLIPGRRLADPLPIVLSFGQIMRGFLYWNWQGPLLHLIYISLLAMLGVFFLKWFGLRGDLLKQVSLQVARLTAVINIGIIAIQQIDAFIVGVYYLMGGLISIFIAGYVAEKIAESVSG